MRELIKTLARRLATIAVAPALLSYAIRGSVLGHNRALQGSTEALALVPGVVGDYLRRAFLSHALAHCAASTTVRVGALFSQTGARLDDRVYVGPYCNLGLVHLERDVLLGPNVHIPSGGATHGTARLDQPILDQPGVRTLVHVGEGTWIGSGAIILADVGRHSVIAAGAVVTAPIPDFVVAGGVPARVLKDRRAAV